jgi:predicted transcriptional regulator
MTNSVQLRNGFKHYTNRDIQVIIENYGKNTIACIAQELNRTPHAVMGKIVKLKAEGLITTKSKLAGNRYKKSIVKRTYNLQPKQDIKPKKVMRLTFDIPTKDSKTLAKLISTAATSGYKFSVA